MSHPLDDVVRAQKLGEAVGIPSFCSAHPWVLRTTLRGDFPILIESTCNQVNQFGGYSGMTPQAFAGFVHAIAAENSFPPEQLILGGDHLGPFPWQDLPAEPAMARAAEMVQAYVRAGYTKIHLDASMKLDNDDAKQPLNPELAARRTARLAHAAEIAAGDASSLRYVIGSEVPIPGGATSHEDNVLVTKVETARSTLEITRAAFVKEGLESAWERVSAVVVQPGVEFGDDFVLDYKPEAARPLGHFIETTPFVYEAHSTDYQNQAALRNLVGDHFAILKVGPALTMAFREAVFALVLMENELLPLEEQSRLVEILDLAMQRDPVHWEKHYHGSERELAFARKYSLSDRIRYYWPRPDVQAALIRLLTNLSKPLPLSLICQFLPDLYPLIRSGQMQNSAASFIAGKIGRLLDDYFSACGYAIH